MKKSLKITFKEIVLSIVFLTLFCSNINSQVKNNSAIWESMKYGMFVHFVYGGEYGAMTPLTKSGGVPANIDEFVEKFDVQKFANDVKTMGFEYVIFTAWHANMGVLYPSKVMKDYGFDQKDHYTSRRDLLGEIMDSLAVRNIKFSIYTHIFVGHDFHPQGSGYFMYDNKTGVITQDMINSGYVDAVNGNSTKWNDFTNKVYDEMSTRYGDKVCAYWFDGTWVPNSWMDKQRMMNTIWKTNPTGAMVANGTPDHGLPYSSKEASSPESGEYSFQRDFPTVLTNDVTTWPSYNRHVALIAGGNWWASQWGTPKYNAQAVYRYTVLQAATNNNGGVGWSFGPFIDGTWEGTGTNTTFEMFKQANVYLNPVAESIKNTRASTSYITKEGSKMNNLSNGYVATKSTNGLYEYIHVLSSRTDRFLRLPNAADGRVFDSVQLLAKRKPLEMIKNDKGYLILLPESENWDPLNTVFRLRLSEFTYKATSTSASFTNPWEGKKLIIRNPSGTKVTHTITNNVCSFTASNGVSYVVSEVKAPNFKSAKIETNARSIIVNFTSEVSFQHNTTGFSLKVNQLDVPITSITQHTDNQSLVLNIDRDITKDDELKLSYSNGSVISVDGDKLADFSDKIIDNLLSGASPRLVSAETNSEGTEVHLTFNQKMQLPVLANTFSINNTSSGNLITISSISLKPNDASTVIVKTVEKLYLENLLKVSYNSTTVKSEGEGVLKPIDSYLIFNNSPGMAPVVKANKLTNNGLTVEVEFNKTLMGVIPQGSLFSLKINDELVTSGLLTAESNKIFFNLKYPVRYGDVIKLSFSGGQLTATDGGVLTEITNYTISNSTVMPTYSMLPGKIEAEKSVLSFGVQTEGTGDVGGGQNVGYIDAGDWLDFAVDVPEAGNYSVEYRVAGQGEGSIVLQSPGINNAVNLSTTNFPATGAWQTWTSVKANVTLSKGKQILRTYFAKGQTNINWLSFVSASTGINDVKETGFEVFPNPANKQFRVISTGFEYTKTEISDLSGRILYSKEANFNTDNIVPINLASGCYIVVLSNSKEKRNKVLLVKN